MKKGRCSETRGDFMSFQNKQTIKLKKNPRLDKPKCDTLVLSLGQYVNIEKIAQPDCVIALFRRIPMQNTD